MLWRVDEAKRLLESELAKSLADAWANCGDLECLAKTPFDPALVGVGKWWAGPFTLGNGKMGPIPFFSLPPVVTCPGHTNFCVRWCYAVFEIANWRAYVREAASYHLSKRKDFADVVDRYLRLLPHRVIRLHVSGDFYDVEYLNKWAAAAERHGDKVFYTYTKSLFVADAALPPNFVVHLSADPHNYREVAEAWNRLRRGFITYVYTPGYEKRDFEVLRHILSATDAHILLFKNHVQHAPRTRVRIEELRKALRSALGALADRVVFDPEEFYGGPQCVDCRLCWLKAYK